MQTPLPLMLCFLLTQATVKHVMAERCDEAGSVDNFSFRYSTWFAIAADLNQGLKGRLPVPAETFVMRVGTSLQQSKARR